MTPIQGEVLELIRTIAQAEQVVMPAGATAEAIVALERHLGMPVPPELRDFLLLCNGANVGPGGIYGITPHQPYLDIAGTLALFREEGWRDKGWIPVASDGCGSYYIIATRVLSLRRHPVYFIDERDYTTPMYVCASDLWHFLRFLLRAEMLNPDKYDTYWPFNKERVLAEDAALALITAPPKPWEVG